MARKLTHESTKVGGGTLFSVATVFACQEFESWLIAGIESLAGKSLEDGRRGVEPGTRAPDQNLEATPRNAKEWLRKVMASGYNPTRDQALLTKMVDLQLISQRMRSFRRLESAISTIVTAVRNESSMVSPDYLTSPTHQSGISHTPPL